MNDYQLKILRSQWGYSVINAAQQGRVIPWPNFDPIGVEMSEKHVREYNDSLRKADYQRDLTMMKTPREFMAQKEASAAIPTREDLWGQVTQLREGNHAAPNS